MNYLPARLTWLLLAGDDDRLLTLVRTGACDAALVPAVEAGRFVRGNARRLGPVGLVLRLGLDLRGERLGVVVRVEDKEGAKSTKSVPLYTVSMYLSLMPRP